MKVEFGDEYRHQVEEFFRYFGIKFEELNDGDNIPAGRKSRANKAERVSDQLGDGDK